MLLFFCSVGTSLLAYRDNMFIKRKRYCIPKYSPFTISNEGISGVVFSEGGGDQSVSYHPTIVAWKWGCVAMKAWMMGSADALIVFEIMGLRMLPASSCVDEGRWFQRLRWTLFADQQDFSGYSLPCGVPSMSAAGG